MGKYDRHAVVMQMNQTLHETYPELSGVMYTCSSQPECYGLSWVDANGKPCVPGRSRPGAPLQRPAEMEKEEWDFWGKIRRDCHFTDIPWLFLLKHLIKVQGGAIK